MLENMLKNALSKPIVITKEQLDNILIYTGESEDGIETMTLKDYLALEVTQTIVSILAEVRNNGREI